MAVEILMPKLGLTMKTGTILKWLKNEGDVVREKEPLLEIETEKLSHQIESPASGTLLKQLAQLGEKYPVSAVVGYVGQPGEQLPEACADAGAGAAISAEAVSMTASKPLADGGDGGGRVFISPLAKKLAAALGVPYRDLKGSGPNGRIVKADIEAFAALSQAKKKDASALVHMTGETDTVLPYTGMRRAIGTNMLQSWTTIPMVTHQVSVDVSALTELRAMLNKNVTEKSARISVNDLLLKLTAVALEKMPIINAAFTEEGIVLHKRVHLGMATALENGLIVPVLHNAHRKSLLELSSEAKNLASKARSGSLSPDDLQGATFTISNLGGYGSVDFFTPIINPPQVGILGVGRIVEAVVPVDGEVKIRPQLGLSFTYDHRVVDGAVAAEFIRILMGLLENPARGVLS